MVVSAGSLEWEIRKFYFDDQSEVITKPISLGFNNTTCYVWAEGAHYVFRVYDNHNRSALIEYELAVIAALDRRGLSFQVPVPVPNNRGEQITRLENTKCGVLFRFIEGDCPGYEHAYLVGSAVGELSSALSQIKVGIKSPYTGSHHIYSVHPLVTKERLLEFLLRPPAPLTLEQTGPFAGELRRMEMRSDEFASLPRQIVHGDLMFANMLVSGDRITGVLDFEFCSPDIRAMELAICLTRYVESEEKWPYAEHFISGYSEHYSLSRSEIEMIPDLIRLRYMVSFIHHLGRYFTGVGSFEKVLQRINATNESAEKMKKMMPLIREQCFSYILSS